MENLELYEALGAAVVALLTWGAKALVAYLQAKTQNELLRSALGRLDDAVIVCVKSVNQTLHRELKALAADGVLSNADKAKLKTRVWESLKAQYGGFEGLSKALGVVGLPTDEAVDKFVKSRIEAVVHDEKRRPQ